MKPFLILLLGAIAVQAQLAVTVSQGKVIGQTAIVPFALTNNLNAKTESARSGAFQVGNHPTMVRQPTDWVAGASTNKTGTAIGATNSFHSIVAAVKPKTTTNLHTKAIYRRINVEAEKLAVKGEGAHVQEFQSRN